VVDLKTGATVTPVPTETPRPTATTEVYCDKTTMQSRAFDTPINIRSAPGFQYPVVGTLLRDKKVLALGNDASRQWVKIDKGWIHAGSLESSWDKLPQAGCTDIGRLGIVPTPASLPATVLPAPTGNASPVCTQFGFVTPRYDGSVIVRKEDNIGSEVVGAFEPGDIAAVQEMDGFSAYLRIDKGWVSIADTEGIECDVPTVTPAPLEKKCKAFFHPTISPFLIYSAPSIGAKSQRVTDPAFKSEITGSYSGIGFNGFWYRIKEGWVNNQYAAVIPSPGCNLSEVVIPEVDSP
jgi:hypothetical protein